MAQAACALKHRALLTALRKQCDGKHASSSPGGPALASLLQRFCSSLTCQKICKPICGRLQVGVSKVGCGI